MKKTKKSKKMSNLELKKVRGGITPVIGGGAGVHGGLL